MDIYQTGLNPIKVTDSVGITFPTGTRMLFQQSAVPSGWVKESNTDYEDASLRFTIGNIVNNLTGTVFSNCMKSGRTTTNATQGGTIANTTQGGTIANATQGGTISKTTAGGTVGNKALSVAMLASHNHTISTSGSSNGIWTKYHTISASTASSGVAAIIDWGNGVTIGNTGSGSNHNHGFTGTEHGHTFTGSAHNHTFTGSAHSHTFTGEAHGHSLDLNIKYIDCIIGIKEDFNTTEESV